MTPPTKAMLLAMLTLTGCHPPRAEYPPAFTLPLTYLGCIKWEWAGEITSYGWKFEQPVTIMVKDTATVTLIGDIIFSPYDGCRFTK